MLIHMLSKALSPITHMHGTAGNVALLQRESVIGTDGQVYSVPSLSGNALRHVLVRVPAAQYLCDALGLECIPYQLADLLWHGGRLTKASPLTASETKELLSCVPFFALLGGAMPGQILEGCLKVSRGLLVCKESADIIERRSGVAVHNVGGSESYVGTYQYTRGAEANNPEAIADRMIYEGECVQAGSVFYHTITLENPSPLVVGCLFKALRDAAKEIGGMGRIGHGELDITWCCDEIDDVDKLVKDYEDFVASTADVVRERLINLFGAEKPAVKAEKSKAPKKTAKKPADDKDEAAIQGAVSGNQTGFDFFNEV